MCSQNIFLMSLCIMKKTVYFDMSLETHKAKIVTKGMMIEMCMQMWEKGVTFFFYFPLNDFSCTKVKKETFSEDASGGI